MLDKDLVVERASLLDIPYLGYRSKNDPSIGFMHEGFRVDDPEQYTRPWFSWANMMFSELAMDHAGIRVKKAQRERESTCIQHHKVIIYTLSTELKSTSHFTIR